MPAPPAPVMVSPRIVTKRDCCTRIAWPCAHCAIAPCSTTPPAGRVGSAWMVMRLASDSALAFLPATVTCSTYSPARTCTVSPGCAAFTAAWTLP